MSYSEKHHVNNATILLFTGLNAAAPTQTMLLHPPGEYSRSTENYIEITATAVAGIQKALASNFEIPQKMYLKMLLIIIDNLICRDS